MNTSRSEFVAVRGIRLHVRRWGNPDAPMLFMLHGWMDVGASFQFVVDALAEDHEFLLAGDVFTRDQLDAYIRLKWEEVYAYEHTPHPIEFAMYYSC